MTDHLGFSLTQLRYFVVSAELGNISEAADRLCASQSTVSSAVMRLERQLGVQLLLRHHARGVTLTPSGRHLLREARVLLGQASNLKARGNALASETAGRLDVGFFSAIAPYLLPSACRMAKERHAALQLNIREAAADQLVEFLQDGRCEVAVTYDFLAGDASFRPLVDLSVHALLAEDDPRGASGSIALRELVAGPLVTLDSPPLVRHFEKVCANAGVPMPDVITTAGLETLRGLVAAGAGFALLHQRTSSTVTLDGGRVRAVDLADPPAPSSLGVAMLPGLAMSSRAEAFVDVLRSAASGDLAASSLA
ncbi:LysR family transcriptional regulator [Streptomyces sp. NPDC039016]|uniref:LysR family transcriptional regulator n=1 Tax=Streptomyces sp. NPDC039016 TaxID=3154330 RepID=UPI0033E0B74C